MSRAPFLTKLTLQNFRSIRNETVEFANPLVLVGRNGSGKSNFVDALAFVSDCMERPLRTVIEDHGGLGAVSHLARAGEEQISIQLELGPEGSIQSGAYSFSIKVLSYDRYIVTHEKLTIIKRDGTRDYINRTESDFSSSVNEQSFVPDETGLMLLGLGSFLNFAPIVRALASMRTYAFDVRKLRGVQARDGGQTLKHDGSNLASVISALVANDSNILTSMGDFLAASTPGIRPAGAQLSGNQAQILFEQDWAPAPATIFSSPGMSDGTLIALALIVAAMQKPSPALVVIEEPEVYLHPGALGMISDLIHLASNSSQVVITTHSPELLDMKWLTADNLRVVEWEDGETHVSKLGVAPVQALRQHLMGAGELLRANALDAAPRRSEETADLLDETPA